MDSNLNVTTLPEDLIRYFDSSGNAGRTESVIESEDSEESETGNEETANETEVETAVPPAVVTTTDGEEDNVDGEDDPEPIKIDHGIQATVEKRNAKTETSHSFVCSNDMPLMTRGIPVFINCIKNAFMDGGYDPRAWDQGTLDCRQVPSFQHCLQLA